MLKKFSQTSLSGTHLDSEDLQYPRRGMTPVSTFPMITSVVSHVYSAITVQDQIVSLIIFNSLLLLAIHSSTNRKYKDRILKHAKKLPIFRSCTAEN